MHDDLVARARAFSIGATDATGQKLPYTDLPYAIHPEEVVVLLSGFTSNVIVHAAGWLHDLVEDTSITLERLTQEFGTEVSSLVRMVSKQSTQADGNRAARFAIDLRHYAQANADGQDIKLSDTTVNVRTIVQRNPKFASIYVPEKKVLVANLTKGNRLLRELARHTVETALLELRDLGYRL